MTTSKNIIKSTRAGKNRLSVDLVEGLHREFKSCCVRKNITVSEGTHQAIENYIYGESGPPEGSINRKERTAKVSPIRDIRCLIVLLMQCGRSLVGEPDVNQPDNFEIQIQLLYSIKRLLEILEQEEGQL